MKTVEIRNLFLKYFEDKNHMIVESAPLVPINDPSLLWINAGVVPMKRYFDGSEIPRSPRIVNSQRCIRTNDIENVGYTARHHTYFEMLGNFSIGDYFKREAIFYAYDFLTSNEWLGLEIEKLYITYYPSDIETKDIWLDLGIDPSHLISLEGNFWEIGEGPCGPCTEIFYDRGSKYDSRGIELLENDIENDRYIEIWNVVLSQFNSSDELERKDYPELPSKNIDTGMGLERISCIMQNTPTNFEIDIFKVIIDKISELSNIEYNGSPEFKVIADHIRTLCLAINDSALPSNEGRGYVLRRILRRAVRYGVKLGFEDPFMYKLVNVVCESLPFYDFKENISMIETIIRNEEEKFYKTLALGEKKLEDFIKVGKISGEEAFLLYDTFGFPIELTTEIATEEGISVDIKEFNQYLEEQKNRSRNSRDEDHGMLTQSEILLNLKVDSKFIGYDTLQSNCNIIAIIKDNQLVDSAIGEMTLILDNTPFYAESGGQVSDRGMIDDLEVLNVIKAPHGQHLHLVKSDHEVMLGSCNASVHIEFRESVTKNHSTTHLLNYALKSYFGEHIKQQGSYVCEEYLRFDFMHYETITDEDVVNIENLVNEYITNWNEVLIEEIPIDEAKDKGAAALFGEKYGDIVRVVKLGNSLELCGGCHVENISGINNFAIASFESKGSGIYRIFATTSNHVKTLLEKSLATIIDGNEELIEKIIESSNQLGGTNDNYEAIITKFETIKSNLQTYINRVELNEIKDELSKIKKSIDKAVKEQAQNIDNIDINIEDYINGNKAIFRINGIGIDAVKRIVDDAFEKYKLDLIFVALVTDKVVFLSKASDNAISNGINCGNLVKEAAIICDGNGGGRANFAQAGGKNVEKVEEALRKIEELV